MIQQIFIQNYALIQSLDIYPFAGFNTITGETGAGKSILLGALGLLLGNRTDTKVLLNVDEKCIVEAKFGIEPYALKPFFENNDLDYESVTTIRREITPSGKSRAFVNDTPVTLSVLKGLGESLVDIHSQHQTLMLGNENFQLRVIDAFIDDKTLFSRYTDSFKQFRKVEKEYDQLKTKASELSDQHDYNSFLLQELSALELIEDEQEELEELVKKVNNSEQIKHELSIVFGALETAEPSVVDSIYDIASHLGQISNLSEKYSKLKERIEGVMHELKDIAQEVDAENEAMDYDPSGAERLKNRLSEIYSLQQKHKVSTIKELLDIQENMSVAVDQSENIGQAMAQLESQKNKAYLEMKDAGSKLTKARNSVFSEIELGITQLLSNLGMPDAKVQITQEEVEPKKDGFDQINILFSANKGISPAEISKVASGGEFSRLMFAIKYLLADKTAMPTIIFDEIDAGISGEVAMKMAEMMSVMSDHHQLITITHLPQVAAKGDKHFFVKKDNQQARTATVVVELTGEDRVYHLAEMIGGANASSLALANARELLTK